MKDLANYGHKDNIGSDHWFRTLTSNAKHMAEYLQSNNDEFIRREYSLLIKNIMSDLIEWQEKGEPLWKN